MPSLTSSSLHSSIPRGSGSGVVPPALLDEKKIPKFYQDAIVLCGAMTGSQLPNTNKVYNLMVTSQLPRTVLSNIWALVNRTKPGQLTRAEFYSCLALIALAQKGESLSALCGVSSLPIPSLQSFIVNEVPVKASASNGKAKKIVADPTLPQFSTKSSSVQSSKVVAVDSLIVDLNSTTSDDVEVAGKNGRRKVPCEEDLFGPDPIATFPNGLCSTNRAGATNGQISNDDDFIDLDFVPSAAEETPTGSGDDQIISEEMEKKTSERFIVWEDCLTQALAIYSEAQQLFSDAHSSTHSISDEQIREVLSATACGHQYQQSLIAVSLVVRRIGCAIEGSACTRTYQQQQQCLLVQYEEVVGKWREVQKLLNEKDSCPSDAIQTCSVDSINASSDPKAACCNICLQPIRKELDYCIEFVSHLYHSQCANFYVNRAVCY